jgi:hypothetical protein
MIKNSLRVFVDGVVERKRIGIEDVRELSREILPDGIVSREEADVLVALDRALSDVDAAFADYLVASLVEFAVWTARPTGYVDQDTARWLETSLGCGTGPTPTAMRAAFEVVKEAQRVDEALLGFVMRHAKHRLDAEDRVVPGLAA